MTHDTHTLREGHSDVEGLVGEFHSKFSKVNEGDFSKWHDGMVLLQDLSKQEDWLRTALTTYGDAREATAREEERERLGMGGMTMVANYHGKAVMLAGGSELANQFIKEVIEPALTPTDYPANTQV